MILNKINLSPAPAAKNKTKQTNQYLNTKGSGSNKENCHIFWLI